jgi:hypothetical protein
MIAMVARDHSGNLALTYSAERVRGSRASATPGIFATPGQAGPLKTERGASFWRERMCFEVNLGLVSEETRLVLRGNSRILPVCSGELVW